MFNSSPILVAQQIETIALHREQDSGEFFQALVSVESKLN
jgi:hypothetical protein